MTTMVIESSHGKHVRTYVTADDAFAVVEDYVSRGFFISRAITRKTTELRSGFAVVTVVRDATDSEGDTPDNLAVC